MPSRILALALLAQVSQGLAPRAASTRRRWLAALDPRPVPARPTPKKLVLKSTPRRRRPPPSESTPSPASTDFEALLPLTHRERSRAAAVARAVDAYLETRSGRARKVVVDTARRSAPLADEVYCRLLLAESGCDVDAVVHAVASGSSLLSGALPPPPPPTSSPPRRTSETRCAAPAAIIGCATAC